jgi:hypothetical protein
MIFFSLRLTLAEFLGLPVKALAKNTKPLTYI